MFDEGLDRLFVCRVAGNIAAPPIVGSIEYAVAHFHVPLVVVVGHSACGACNAAIAARDEGTTAPGSVGAVVDAIFPAVGAVPAKIPLDARRARVVHENARRSAAVLRESPIIGPGARVMFAVHDLASGAVTFG